jgi:hypothetical protein
LPIATPNPERNFTGDTLLSAVPTVPFSITKVKNDMVKQKALIDIPFKDF